MGLDARGLDGSSIPSSFSGSSLPSAMYRGMLGYLGEVLEMNVCDQSGATEPEGMASMTGRSSSKIWALSLSSIGGLSLWSRLFVVHDV